MGLTQLAQLELDRFHASLHVLLDFFDATCADPKHVEGTLTDLAPPATEPPAKKPPASSAKKGGQGAKDAAPPEPQPAVRALHPPNLLSTDMAREIAAGAAAAAAALAASAAEAAEHSSKAAKPATGKAKAAATPGSNRKGSAQVCASKCSHDL